MITALRDGDGRLTAEDTPALPLWGFTTTLIAALCVDAANRGELSLDTSLSPHAWTLRQLLCHRAGLGDYGALQAYTAAVAARETPWTAADFLRAVPPETPVAAPDQVFRYSNIGYLLAVQTLEGATGQTLTTLLRTRLADPLGLPSLKLAETAEDFADLPFPAEGYHPGWVAHGCAMATPADAVGALDAILGNPALADMRVAHPVDAVTVGRPWTKTGYGLGLMIGAAGTAGRSLGHSGGGAFAACAIYAYPDLPGAPVAACFTAGPSEAPAEHATVALARGS